MEPVLAKAFAGFKVVAVSAHQIGFSAFLAIGAYSHAWRSLNNIHADHSITSMPIAQ
ncbi:TPA: hypothetical protein MYQ30_004050 [Citrobacter freundii]|nr:hypothetical protein [Citrobacter freundii]